MNKTFKIYNIIWAICLFLFNVIFFLIPNNPKFSGSFWIGYVFISIAFIGHLICVYFAFKTAEAKKMFYNMPIILVSYIGLGLMLAVGTVTMVIPSFPIWFDIIICFVVLAFASIATITSFASVAVVNDADKRNRLSSHFIRKLSSEAEHLIAESKSDEIKSESKKVYEAIRYSDPVSNIALIEINERIQRGFEEYKNAVLLQDFELAKAIGKELLATVDERGQKCKLFK